MSTWPIRRLARWVALGALLIAPACHTNPLQGARLISEDRSMVVIAIPENTTRLREAALRVAQEKLGPDVAFVEGKEVVTEDNVGKKSTDRKIFAPNGQTEEQVYRREYQVTFRKKNTSGG